MPQLWLVYAKNIKKKAKGGLNSLKFEDKVELTKSLNHCIR